MTTLQRQVIRGHLIRAGFKRITSEMPENPIYYDHGLGGAYREVWQSNKDNTIITLDWDYKSKE